MKITNPPPNQKDEVADSIDKKLFISTQANDVDGNLINRKQEIFSVLLDGSNQQRLTNNADEDVYPNLILLAAF
jgi:hypothetical protein